MKIRYTGDNEFMRKYAKLLPDGFVDSNFVTAPQPDFFGEDWWVRCYTYGEKFCRQMAWKDQEYDPDWDKQKYIPFKLHKFDVRIEGPDAERFLDMLAFHKAVNAQVSIQGPIPKRGEDVRLEASPSGGFSSTE
jgi:hypothetical protein